MKQQHQPLLKHNSQARNHGAVDPQTFFSALLKPSEGNKSVCSFHLQVFLTLENTDIT